MSGVIKQAWQALFVLEKFVQLVVSPGEMHQSKKLVTSSEVHAPGVTFGSGQLAGEKAQTLCGVQPDNPVPLQTGVPESSSGTEVSVVESAVLPSFGGTPESSNPESVLPASGYPTVPDVAQAASMAKQRGRVMKVLRFMRRILNHLGPTVEAHCALVVAVR